MKTTIYFAVAVLVTLVSVNINVCALKAPKDQVFKPSEDRKGVVIPGATERTVKTTRKAVVVTTTTEKPVPVVTSTEEAVPVVNLEEGLLAKVAIDSEGVAVPEGGTTAADSESITLSSCDCTESDSEIQHDEPVPE